MQQICSLICAGRWIGCKIVVHLQKIGIMRSAFLSTVGVVLLLGCGGHEESGQKAIDQIWKRLDANLASNLVNEASVCIKQASSIPRPEGVFWYPAKNDIPIASSLSGWPQTPSPVLILRGADAPFLLVMNSVVLFPLCRWKVDIHVKPGGGFTGESTNGIAREFNNEVVFRAWQRSD
jgi:hypothetical protein